MPSGSDRDDTEARLRKLEDIIIRMDERSKLWDAGLNTLSLHSDAISHLKMALGELRLKSGLVIMALGSIGAIVGSVLSALITRLASGS